MNNSTDVVHGDIAIYIRKYGMVVDNASWSTDTRFMDVWGQFSACSSVVYLVSP